MATTRPVLNGNNIQLILAGLDLLIDRHQEMAEEFARSSDFEMAGMELSVVTDTQALRDRMLDLLTGLIDSAMAEGLDEMQAEDDGYVTADEDVDIPTPPETDEVGTVSAELA